MIAMLVIILFVVMMVLGLTLLRKINPPISLEEDLEISRIQLTSFDLEYLVGKEGVAITDLKPTGKCRIDGIEFDVKAESDKIEKGERICISRIQGNRIMAREI